METVNPSWTDLAIFICNKCQKSWTHGQFNKNKNYSEDLKTQLKTYFNNNGQKGKVRVMTSSCLGECPEKKQAVSVVQPKTIGADRTFVITPFDDEQKLLNELKQIIGI